MVIKKFAWKPVILDDPPWMRVWLEFYYDEQTYIRSGIIWMWYSNKKTKEKGTNDAE